MGKSLYAGSSGARSLYAEANRVLGWDLARICFEGPEAELTQTRICQPALFVHGMALHTILKEQGKLGDVGFALGLSLGEITALTAAGVFDFATGLRVVAERGRLMHLACEQRSGPRSANCAVNSMWRWPISTAPARSSFPAKRRGSDPPWPRPGIAG